MSEEGKLTYVADKKEKKPKETTKKAPKVDNSKLLKEKDQEIENLKKEIMALQKTRSDQLLASGGKNSAEYKLVGVISCSKTTTLSMACVHF